jgi:hypothetical protein
MKNAIAFFLLVILSNCQQSTSSDTDAIKSQIRYFKDVRTGLCFGSINSISGTGYSVSSITCVPCDSLKRFEGFYQILF